MNNISLDTTSFSEQLGIYDFFNVLLAGVIFVCRCSFISTELSTLIWGDIKFQKGLCLVLGIYIIGMILQELGSLADRYLFKIYKGMSYSILKGKIDKTTYKEKTTNKIVKNPILLERYRKTADKLIKEFVSEKDDGRFENDYVSGYVFSICQYYVSIKGNDKKVEKLRALFAMSKTLIVCFFLLSLTAIFSVIFTKGECVIFKNLSVSGCTFCSGKIFLAGIFALIGGAFYLRARRTMKNFLLILLGTYDAIIRSEENESKTTEVSYDI